MDRDCLLAVQGEGIVGEDYRVFIADGQSVSQVLVLGHRDPDGGGKHVQPQIRCQTLSCFLNIFHFYRNLYFVQSHVQCAGLNFGPHLKRQNGSQKNWVLFGQKL